MKLYDTVQWAIVIGIVLISALYIFGRVVPKWRVQVALSLQQPGHAPWVNRLGARIAGSGGCGSCDTCGSCATPKTSEKNKI